MISDRITVVCVLLLGVIALFFIWSLKKRQRLHLLHRIYLYLMGFYAIWISTLIVMRFTPLEHETMLFILDGFTQSAYFCAVLYLCIAIVFAHGCEKLPRWCWLLFIMPVATLLVCFTNPLHHLQYVKFSIIRSEVILGPFMKISGTYCYLCIIASIVLMINFARKNTSGLYRKQALLFSLGGLSPLLVSVAATWTNANLSIAATAMGFIPLIVCNGIAIYQLHLLDIMPVATQRLLDWISDCYVILSEKGLVISYNKPFAEMFASQYGIAENRYLRDCVKEEDVSKKTAIYNMIMAVEACEEAQSTISYEQPATLVQDGVVQKSYYITDVSPLVINEKAAGYIIIFKDMTQLKKVCSSSKATKSKCWSMSALRFWAK
ncbi:histidine kinase N-terminal 7TM domain-containing protein [Oscillibacter sp.]|uniref:histidine kinase N-terminal 7TM domain-containing protein n=1 Tax=Oscillibacter sp. TaxID=1945593 RepID=UPI0026037899|nr:histidine kinase N-terminal 7TM domain-containing protein [Oscillibacter sp.]MDD3347415.1 histidine kinase N-terminal 7TM domain-containing protein [Oscillibacter sp.]